MTGASDPDNRRMMRFGSQLDHQEKAMLANTRELVNFRRRSALRQGDFLPLFADQNVLAYMRSDVSQRILVLLNKSAEPKTQLVQLPEIYGVSEPLTCSAGKLHRLKAANCPLIFPRMVTGCFCCGSLGYAQLPGKTDGVPCIRFGRAVVSATLNYRCLWLTFPILTRRFYPKTPPFYPGRSSTAF
ncbi:MAG: hypothetical protein R3C26_01915 [Calditrichia bacterium]